MNEGVWGHGGITSTGHRQNTGTKTSLNFCVKHFLPQDVFVELSAKSLRIPAYKVSVRPPFVRSEAELELTGNVNNRRLCVLKENAAAVWPPHKAIFTL